MRPILKYFVIIISALCILACASLKEPEIVSIDYVSLEKTDDHTFNIFTKLSIFNPNNFNLKSDDLKLDIYLDSIFIGELTLMEDLSLKKRDTSIINTKLIHYAGLMTHPLSLTDVINLHARGTADIPYLPFKYNFEINHQLKISDFINPLLQDNLKESDVQFRSIKIENIKLSQVDIAAALTFKNNFDFDYTIEQLDISIFDSKKYNNLVGKSTLEKPINVPKTNEVDVTSSVSLNTLNVGKSLIKNLLNKSYSFYLKAEALIVFNKFKIPITLYKQVDYNPLSQEIKIR